MVSLRLRYPSLAALALTTLLHGLASAQNCYYPDGAVALGDAACTGSGNCCPFNWQCLSNGLCYLPSANYFGRYTCTDRSWQSGDCTQLCTQNNTAVGAEAIIQCADGSWCCDGDRSFNCCTTSNEEFFRLPSGSSIASITRTVAPSSVPSAVTNSPATVTDGTPVSATSPSVGPTSSTVTSNNPVTSSSLNDQTSSTYTYSSTTTDSRGVASTVTVVSVIGGPTSGASSSSSSGSSNVGTTVGLAVGIPVAAIILALAGLFFWWRKHRNAKLAAAQSPPPTYNDYTKNPEMTNSYGHFPPDGRAPELDSFPVAVGRKGQGPSAELPGSQSLASTVADGQVPPGTPPQYSPSGLSAAAFARSKSGRNSRLVNSAPVEIDGASVPSLPPSSHGNGPENNLSIPASLRPGASTSTLNDTKTQE